MKKLKDWELIVLFISALGLILFIVSCNPAAKLAKDNEKAYQRVLTDSAMFRSIGDKWRKINPSLTDTSIGETEVLILSDTQYIRNTDTLVEFMPDTVRITVTKTNTVTHYVIDNKAVNELQDSLHARDLRIAQHKGQLSSITLQLNEQEQQTNTERKRGNLWFWLCMGAIALGLGSHVVRFLPSNLLKR